MTDCAMAIIDGTGAWDDDVYKRSMEQSFCSQLYSQLADSARYERGPSGEGYRIRERGVRAVEYLQQQRGRRLMLAGYSRGGSAAVMAAAMLDKLGVPVEALFLFDPVARHFSGDTTAIPGNVRRAWVARRKIGAPEMNKYDFTLLGDPAGHNPVRNWFGTTATEAAAGVELHSQEFLGSHGALGGVGWRHVSEDPECQGAVAGFMNEGLAALGLGVRLVSKAPNSEA